MDQEIDNSGICKCKDSNQTLNESSGECECKESDQKIEENGECICKDPNAELDNNHQCQCKVGYYPKDDKCVSGDDTNHNHMYDHYDTSDIQGIKDKLGTDYRTHAECDSESGKGDGFCDSFMGYQCSIRCVSDDQCVSDQSIDGTQYHFVCRPDGRCAPDTFTTI